MYQKRTKMYVQNNVLNCPYENLTVKRTKKSVRKNVQTKMYKNQCTSQKVHSNAFFFKIQNKFFFADILLYLFHSILIG